MRQVDRRRTVVALVVVHATQRADVEAIAVLLDADRIVLSIVDAQRPDLNAGPAGIDIDADGTRDGRGEAIEDLALRRHGVDLAVGVVGVDPEPVLHEIRIGLADGELLRVARGRGGEAEHRAVAEHEGLIDEDAIDPPEEHRVAIGLLPADDVVVGRPEGPEMDVHEPAGVVGLVDLDARREDLAPYPPEVRAAGVPGIDPLVDAGEHHIVEVDAAEAIQHLEEIVVVGWRPGGSLRGPVRLAHRDVADRRAAGGDAGEGDGREGGRGHGQPCPVAGIAALGEARALQTDGVARDRDGRVQPIGARAEGHRAAGRAERVDGGLDGRGVVGNAVADGAEVAHIHAAVGQHGPPELGEAGALGGGGGGHLHEGREVAVRHGRCGRQLADSEVGHEAPSVGGEGWSGVLDGAVSSARWRRRPPAVASARLRPASAAGRAGC